MLRGPDGWTAQPILKRADFTSGGKHDIMDGTNMEITTKLFGRVEFSGDSVIVLEEGLIGISEKKRFLLIEKEDFLPFSYLQSIDDPNLVLIVINPFMVEKSYQFYIHEDDLKAIDVQSPEDFQLLSVVIFAPRLEDIKVNLKAPVIINIHNKKAKQVILLNEDYSVSEPLIKPSTFITAGFRESPKP
jgi:flagellar assembly factor FliW